MGRQISCLADGHLSLNIPGYGVGFYQEVLIRAEYDGTIAWSSAPPLWEMTRKRWTDAVRLAAMPGLSPCNMGSVRQFRGQLRICPAIFTEDQRSEALHGSGTVLELHSGPRQRVGEDSGTTLWVYPAAPGAGEGSVSVPR